MKKSSVCFLLLVIAASVLTILVAIFTALGGLIPATIAVCFTLCGVMLVASVVAWILFIRRNSKAADEAEPEQK